MSVVASGYGAWLKSASRYSQATISGAAAAWGDKAVTTSILSPIANKADADTESVRQAQFLGGPNGQDKAVIKGRRKDLIGKVITLYGDRLGYESGAVVFVIGAAEAEQGSTTTITVLKRLYT